MRTKLPHRPRVENRAFPRDRIATHHLQQRPGRGPGPDEGQDLPAVGQVRLQVQVQVHVGVLDGADGLDVVHAEALRDLLEVRGGHVVEEPRHCIFDGLGLLVDELVDVGLAGDVLHVDVVGGLPGGGVPRRDPVPVPRLHEAAVLVRARDDGALILVWTGRWCRRWWTVVSVVVAVGGKPATHQRRR